MDDLKENVTALAKKAAEAEESTDAMRFAQAALSVAQAFATIETTLPSK